MRGKQHQSIKVVLAFLSQTRELGESEMSSPATEGIRGCLNTVSLPLLQPFLFRRTIRHVFLVRHNYITNKNYVGDDRSCGSRKCRIS